MGSFKLDWIFVKPYIEYPRRSDQPWLFALPPPRIMRDLNKAVPERVSDHAPLTVDLLFAEPHALKPTRAAVGSLLNSRFGHGLVSNRRAGEINFNAIQRHAGIQCGDR